MKKKYARANPSRIYIPELSRAPKGPPAEDISTLMTAGVPFTMRPLVPEDLGTVAQKGRTDLVRLTDRSGTLKMTRTLDAEVRRVRGAPPPPPCPVRRAAPAPHTC